MLKLLAELFPYIQNVNFEEKTIQINSYSGWVEFKEYHFQNSGINAIFRLRYAYSSEIFNQNLIDINYCHEELINNSTIHYDLFILYLCNEKLTLKEDVKKIQLPPDYIFGRFYSSVFHYYLSSNFWKPFNITLPKDYPRLHGYSTTKILNEAIFDRHLSSIEGGIRTCGLFKTSTANKPLISIITTVLNNKVLIEQTIQSVINQSYDNIEYIIIDAGSTDGTIEVLKRYSQYIDYFLSEKDNGIYYGMDKGIRLANGDYLMMLNSDDLYFNNKVIEEVAKVINSFPQIDFFYGDSYIIRNNKNVDYKISTTDRIIYRNSIPHPTVVLKRCVYFKEGGFNLDYKISADYDLILTLIFKKHPCRKLNFSKVIFRDGGFSAKNHNAFKEYRLIMKEKGLLSVRILLYNINEELKWALLQIIERIIYLSSRIKNSFKNTECN
jgi:glycosyltransferase involved in cell wall biosynthesis